MLRGFYKIDLPLSLLSVTLLFGGAQNSKFHPEVHFGGTLLLAGVLYRNMQVSNHTQTSF